MSDGNNASRRRAYIENPYAPCVLHPTHAAGRLGAPTETEPRGGLGLTGTDGSGGASVDPISFADTIKTVSRKTMPVVSSAAKCGFANPTSGAPRLNLDECTGEAAKNYTALGTLQLHRRKHFRPQVGPKQSYAEPYTIGHEIGWHAMPPEARLERPRYPCSSTNITKFQASLMQMPKMNSR